MFLSLISLLSLFLLPNNANPHSPTLEWDESFDSLPPYPAPKSFFYLNFVLKKKNDINLSPTGVE